MTTSSRNADGIDQALMRSQGDLYAMLTDHFGSVVKICDTSGAVVASCDYHPFGKTSVTGDPKGNTLGFTGREYDSGTGLYYYRWRVMDPNVGRFTSEDPLGFVDGMNLYTYVANEPTKNSDPMGESRLQPPGMPSPGPPGVGQVWNKIKNKISVGNLQNAFNTGLNQCSAAGSSSPVGCSCCVITACVKWTVTGELDVTNAQGTLHNEPCDKLKSRIRSVGAWTAGCPPGYQKTTDYVDF